MSIYWLEQSAGDVPISDDWLSSTERAVLSQFHFCKRRDEWRLGRWTAKSCIAAYPGMSHVLRDLSRIEIRSAQSGAPFAVLPDESASVAISLTHRAGKAMCAAAPYGVAVGCDLELVELRSAAFLSDYFTPDEQALVQQTSVHKRAVILNLLWSAKESALKALHLGLRIDTRCLRVRPLADVDNRQLLSCPVRLFNVASCRPESNGLVWQPLEVVFCNELAFFGWWTFSDTLVRTVVLSSQRPTDPQAGGIQIRCS